MNSFSLLVGLSTALIIVLAVAAVVLAGGIAGVLISGRIAANRGGKHKKQPAEKKAEKKVDKPKPAAPTAKKVEEKPVKPAVEKEVKEEQPAPVKVEEIKPEPEEVEEVKPLEGKIEDKVEEVTEAPAETVEETTQEAEVIPEQPEVVEEVAEVEEQPEQPEPEEVEEVAEVTPAEPETIEEPEAEAVEEVAVEEQPEAIEEPVHTEVQPEQPEETAEAEEPEATEAVVEEQPEEQPEPIPEPVIEQKPESKVEVVKSDDGNAFVRIRYNRSFTAKLIQADDKVKNYYSQIKNELKKYPVKERTSWRYETFKKGRQLLAKITLRGKTLCLYCALDAADYAGTKYKVEDVSSKKSNAAVPARFRIKNDRRAKYSEKIIADLMAKHSLEGGESKYEDYAAQYPYEELEPLIERKLVKLLALKTAAAESEVATLPVTGALPQEVLEEVAAAEPEVVEELVEEQPVEEVVEELVEEQPVEQPVEEVVEETVEEQPEAIEEVEEVAEESVEEVVEEEAAQLPPEEILEEVSVTQADEILPDEKVEIYVKEIEKVSDKTKRAIVNIDTLGKHFKANEKVTLEEIKRRVQGVNKKTTYVKVLARGTLDKPLEVEADDFSPAAVKMVILTGGKVNGTRKSTK
ncbi:MAG: uL15 family ribosomal protein, partial [Clostridia bacterium]|nr:uL15 family ribosomal protein [Clostridia bacterium]